MNTQRTVCNIIHVQYFENNYSDGVLFVLIIQRTEMLVKCQFLLENE